MIDDEFYSVRNMIEVKLVKPDSFKLIIETLTRIGLASETGQTLYQIVFLLHKRGRYYIAHYKELEMLDGFEATMSPKDYGRRNAVARLLQNWNMIRILSPERLQEDLNDLMVLKHKASSHWTLKPKYLIGHSSNRGQDRAY